MFLIAYYILLIVSMFVKNFTAEIVLLAISLLVQVYFFIDEAAHFMYHGCAAYLSRARNLGNFIQFVVLVIYIIVRIAVAEKTLDPLAVDFEIMILRLILLVIGFFNMTFYIRIFNKIGFMAQMVNKTVQAIIPFTVLFLCCVTFFTLSYMILGVKVE